MLSVEGLEVSYGGALVLKGLSFEVRDGEIVSLIGSNGAGKTTTLKTITGLKRALKGNILWNGKSIKHLPAHKIARLGISHCREGRQLFADMSVRENLLMGGYTLPKKLVHKRIEELLENFPVVSGKLNQLAGTLSGGEQQLVAIVRALVIQPSLLILDEPSLGLSPVATKTIFAELQRIVKSGVSILIVEQNAQQSLAISDRGYVIELGKIVLAGTGEELLNNEQLLAAYLGSA